MKLAVVASGWHFPLHFYEAIARQKLPEGWSMDMFCVSHRDPHFSGEDKKEFMSRLGWSYREVLDRLLYAKFASVGDIERLGWTYLLEPNTIGDLGNVNQWLEKYDYKKYDMLLVTHDDNLIPTNTVFTDILARKEDWLLLTNSAGSVPASRKERLFKWWNPEIAVRGSFEFIKPEVLDMIGGKFDLGDIVLTREGETSASTDLQELRDWNKTTHAIDALFRRPDMKRRLVPLSPYYRVSKYCIEGERGYISFTQEQNTNSENKGFRMLQRAYPSGRF